MVDRIKLKDTKKQLENFEQRLEEEALEEGVLNTPEYREVKKELKKRVLENADVTEKDYDSFVYQESYDRSENKYLKSQREIQEVTDFNKKKKARADRSQKMFDGFKKNPLTANLSDEKINREVDTINEEADRVYSSTDNRQRRKYVKYLEKAYLEDLSIDVWAEREYDEAGGLKGLLSRFKKK